MTLKKLFVYAGLVQKQQNSLSRQHCSPDHQHKTLGVHSHRRSWPTSMKALPHRQERLLKVPDVISVSSTTSLQTLAILLKMCAQHGVLEINVSDYGM